MKFIGIIPSRFASTRFPGKPLVKIGNKSMIQHVYERVTSYLPNAFVATDDERIQNEVKMFGGNVVMTSSSHKSGTDRCAEAIVKIEENTISKFDVVINIQGDEPFIQSSQLIKLMKCFSCDDVEIATLIKEIKTNEEIFNENLPKVLVNKLQEAIYFSRSPIPFVRDCLKEHWHSMHLFYRHIGLYAYRKDILLKITKLPSSKLEQAESLEQLRWIENGFKIRTQVSNEESFAVDTPEDLLKIEELIKKGYISTDFV